jgi:ABC-type uncharacterized transport system permease subunit
LANVSEVISGVLLTSLLLILGNYVLRFRVQHQNETTISLDDYGQYYHVTLLVAALAVILAYVCVWGSGGWVLATGCGESETVLSYSGFRAVPILSICVATAAIVTSVGGAARVIDQSGVYTNGEFSVIAFSGIIGAVLFGDRPLELISACAVLSVLEAARLGLQSNVQLPSQVVAGLEALVLIGLLLRKKRLEAKSR